MKRWQLQPGPASALFRSTIGWVLPGLLLSVSGIACLVWLPASHNVEQSAQRTELLVEFWIAQLVAVLLIVIGLQAGLYRRRLLTMKKDFAERTAMLERLIAQSEQSDYIEFLYHIGEELKTGLDLHELLQRLVTRSVSITQAEHGSIIILDKLAPQGLHYLAVGSYSEPLSGQVLMTLLNEGFPSWVLRHRQGIRIGNIDQDPRWLRLEEHDPPFLSAISVPLLDSAGALGVLSVAHSCPHFFAASDSLLMNAVAAQAAAAIRNAQLYEELQDSNWQLSKANQLKSEFLAKMSHELRTPLNAIIGFTELTVSGVGGEISSVQRNNLMRVLRNGQHLLELINEILDIAKIESGAMTIAHEPFLLHDLIRNTISSIEALAANKQLHLTSKGFEQVPAIYHGDEGRLRQVLLNLLSNAIKFTPAGGWITVRLDVYAENRLSWLVIEVADNGIGIDPANIELIWGEFWQADNSNSRQQSGTGLGLTIVRHLTGLMGGKCSVSSAPGQGSTFRVQLPLHESLEQRASEAASAPGTAASPAAGSQHYKS